MSLRYYDTNSLTNIANSIRAQANTNNTMTVEQMPLYIENIPAGGSFKYVSFALYDGTDIPLENIDFDVNKLYNRVEGKLFYNCSTLINIPSNINIFKFKNLDYAFWGCNYMNIYKLTGTYPYLESANDFYSSSSYLDGFKNPVGGKFNLVFNLPNVKYLANFISISQSSLQFFNWSINIYAPNALVYDKSISLNQFYLGMDYTNNYWNLNLYMPNLIKLSNFFRGFYNNTQKLSSNSFLKLFSIFNAMTHNVTDASYFFSGLSLNNNGYLPNIDTRKFENITYFLDNVSMNASNYTRYTTNLVKMDFSNVKYADYYLGNVTSQFICDNITYNINLPNAISAKGLFGAHWERSSSSSSSVNFRDRNIYLPKCEDVAYMFAGMRNLKNLPNAYTPSVKNAFEYASSCQNLINVPENFIDSTNVVNIGSMFGGCNNLSNDSLVNIAKFLVNLNTQNIEHFKYANGYGVYNLNYSGTARMINESYNAITGGYEQYIYSVFNSSNKRINTSTVGAELVAQLEANGWKI